LAAGGLRAVHLEVDRNNAAAMKLYTRAGFRPREDYMLMSRIL
ncbi:GNAT family N-acetyltransferase, partial [Sulfitobacter sp. M23508]